MLIQFWKRHADITLLGTIGVLLFSIGFLGGTIWQKRFVSLQIPDLVWAEESSSEVSVLFLKKIENGVLSGNNEGKQVRFVIGEKQEEIVPLQSGEFSFDVTTILPNLKQIPAPTGMLFVASKRGKKFWPLDAPEANMLSPKNRIFFKNTEEATSQGFERGR